MADQRISDSRGGMSDDALKIVRLHANDGLALLGYAGLGRTLAGIEVSDWINNVLRGRFGSVEYCLGVIADSARRRLPRHLLALGLGFQRHTIVALALRGEHPSVYTIDITVRDGSDAERVVYARRQWVKPPNQRSLPVRIISAGSGKRHLPRDRSSQRAILGVVRANETGRIGTKAVVKYLARLNVGVAQQDQSVSHSCLVAWGNRDGSGGQAVATAGGITFGASLPTIVNGIDMRALDSVVLPLFWGAVKTALNSGKPPKMSIDKVRDGMARLPCEPDEELL